MHLLILGGRGFIGSRLVRYFSALPDWTVESLSSFECNLIDSSSVPALQRRISAQTCVVFCSAISRLRDDSIRSFHQNVEMAKTVAAALAPINFHSLVFCSSIDVYGRPPRENPVTEYSGLYPAGYYGYSKLVSEYILEQEIGYERGLAVLRLPGIYSLDDYDPSALGKLFCNLRENRTVLLSGGGIQTRTYLAVAELAVILEDIFRRRWSGLVNLGSSESYTIAASVEIMKAFLGSSSPILVGPPNGSEFDITISNERVRHEFPGVELLPLERYLKGLRGVAGG